MPDNFGADDRLKCPKCNGTMRVVRRTPHPERGTAYELQNLECQACQHGATRTVDAKGQAPAA